jgi:hypothetical protein
MGLRANLFGVLAMASLLAACGAYETDIDLAPLDQRPAGAPLAEGRYCAAEWNRAGTRIEVRAGEDCGLITWDAATRELVLDDDPPEPDARERVAPARIAGDLFLLQMTDDKSEGERRPDEPRYASMLVLMAGDAMVGLPSLDDGPYRDLAVRQTGLVFRKTGPDERPVLVSGDRDAALAFISAAGALAIRLNDQGDRGFSVLVRDDGRTDHAPAPAQKAAIQRLMAEATALAKAPAAQ